MARLLFAAAFVLLTGCAAQGVIPLPELAASARPLQLVDVRRQEERTGTVIADCSNLGKGWVGIYDAAFSYPRTEYLKRRIEQAYPQRFAELKVTRFQTCYANLAADGRKGDTDAVRTVIAFELDGQAYAVDKARVQSFGPDAVHSFANPVLVTAVQQSIEEAISLGLEMANAR